MMGEQIAMACHLLLTDLKPGDKLREVNGRGSRNRNIVITSVQSDGFTYDLDPPVDEWDVWAGQPVTLLARGRKAAADDNGCVRSLYERRR